ncbi:glycosyltransferase [Plantactinospora sp. WMMB334]|uniref:glycosyltransferase n=1 Tax=Plantactinospora sp. WMMB334 TaxID=3404119 RepID=UPI003B96443B
MSRFLFVMPPLAGHLNPAVPVARVLTGLGHEVAWTGPESHLRPRVGEAATVFPTGLRPYRGQRDRGLRALRSLWQGFVVPYARAILPAVDRAVRSWHPDVLVVDQHTLAGALVAHRHRLPWATLAATLMELTQPYRALPRVDAWIQGHLAGLWRHADLPGEPEHDLRFSPYLVVAFTTAALVGPAPLPGTVALVGPAFAERPPVPDFPWHRLAPDRRRVLVTTGTLAADLSRNFYPRVARAFEPLAGTVQAVLNTDPATVPGIAPDRSTDAGPAAAPADLGRAGPLFAPRVPMLELMPRLDALVCHGGLGTVMEALAHGVPLVVAPIRYDQPVIAQQVVAAGAGIRVPFGRVTARRLGAAVTALLEEPGYRAAAGRIRDSFRRAGGAPAAARHLVALARSPNVH